MTIGNLLLDNLPLIGLRILIQGTLLIKLDVPVWPVNYGRYIDVESK